MNITLTEFQETDRPFLDRMLYEAVFWRKGPSTPSFQDAMEMPEIRRALGDFGEKPGDAALIARLDSAKSVGAVWYRYWERKADIRGFVEETIPILAIGVEEEVRGRGVGSRLLEGLFVYGRAHSLERISLCVSKDNPAIRLYRKTGFIEWMDLDHSINMLKRL